MNRRARRDVALRLHSAALHLLRAVRAVDGESGLSAARLSALSVLVFGGPRTIGTLAATEGVRSPTMTALVNHLEGDGLVVRTTGPGDQRRVLVEATSEGRERMQAAQGRRIDLLVSMLEGLTADELATLDRASTIVDGIIRRHVPERGTPTRRG